MATALPRNNFSRLACAIAPSARQAETHSLSADARIAKLQVIAAGAVIFVTPALAKIGMNSCNDVLRNTDRSMTRTCKVEAPRPLVMRFGAMGDTVILLTLIRMLHQRFGTFVDVLSSGSWTRPLLEGQPGVGRIYLLHSGGTPYAFDPQKRHLAEQLRKRGPSMTWACQYLPKARELLLRARHPRHIGGGLESKPGSGTHRSAGCDLQSCTTSHASLLPPRHTKHHIRSWIPHRHERARTARRARRGTSSVHGVYSSEPVSCWFKRRRLARAKPGVT